MAPQGRKEAALEQVESFAAGRKPGWFAAFSRAEVAKDLKDRINNPTGVNQQNSSLCGPAAFIYALASDQPNKYVKMVGELYEDGATFLHGGAEHWAGIWVRPGAHLRTYRPPGRFQSADWISMASLRDSSNWFLTFGTSGDSIFRAGTSASDLCTWLNRFGGYSHVVDHTRLYGGKEDLLHRAYAYYTQKYRVFLNINSSILNDANSSWSIRPDHWVVLDSPIVIGRDTVQMNVFTWGYTIGWGLKTGGVKVDKQNFLDHFYGYVAAKY
jgi:hypothetical protein